MSYSLSAARRFASIIRGADAPKHVGDMQRYDLNPFPHHGVQPVIPTYPEVSWQERRRDSSPLQPL